MVEVIQLTVISFRLYDWDRTGDDESLGRWDLFFENAFHIKKKIEIVLCFMFLVAKKVLF